VSVAPAPNGIRYAAWGETRIPRQTWSTFVGAVPITMSEALTNRAYYFVPLAITDTGETMIAPAYSVAWATVPSATATPSSAQWKLSSFHPPG